MATGPTKAELQFRVEGLEAALEASKASNSRKRGRLEYAQETECRLRADRNSWRKRARENAKLVDDAELAGELKVTAVKQELDAAIHLVGATILEATLEVARR